MSNNSIDPGAPGLFRRFAAILYDGLLLLALWFAASVVLMAASSGSLASPDRPLWLLYGHRAGLLLVTYMFFAGFWTHGGQTLGMRAWRLKLVSIEGGPVHWFGATKRFFAAILSLGALGLGFLWALFDPEKLTCHDRLSDTRLVLLPKSR
jgi:uncharacterized RDD family membrane protein YckC